jgi:hypothetical protein
MGRALPTEGTSVVAAAIVQFVRVSGSRVPENDIIYTWKLNGRVLGSMSGRGKSSIIIPGPGLYGEYVLAVEAESIDYAFQSSETTVISGVEPHLVLYPDYPVGGVSYHTALTNQAHIDTSELTVAGVPYYMLINAPDDPSLSYTWSVNRSPVDISQRDPSRLTLSIGSAARGMAHVELAVEHALVLLQDTSRSWVLQFGQYTSSPENDPFRQRVDIQ